MNLDRIFCPGGTASQTGSAITLRCLDVNLMPIRITDVPNMLEGEVDPFVVPIWNSNEGEIGKTSYIWDLIESNEIRLFDIWAKSINFWYVVRANSTDQFNAVGSVAVAQTQCSNFLADLGKEFRGYPLTTEAFGALRSGEQLDGVLVAPGEGEGEQDFEVVSRSTANANNFTSFVILGSSASVDVPEITPRSWLTGVSIASLAGPALTDQQYTFFDKLFDFDDLSLIPKLVFVFKRAASVGLLFEGDHFTSADFLDAEDISEGDIQIHEDVGELEQPYYEQLESLISDEFPSLCADDFVLHIGIDSFLFICPPLKMYTHGYDRDAVEPVVRLYIDKVFEFIAADGSCTEIERSFFERNKKAWREEQSDFMEFTIIRTES